MNLGIAIAITAEGFKHRKDKGGRPYILHCLRVMRRLHTNDDELNCIAVMHDNVEDKISTLESLRALGFSNRVITAIDLLTHDPSVPYEDYIRKLAHNDDARAVKLSDLRDNSDITRLKGLSLEDHDRLSKYSWAYTYLKI